MADEAKHVHSFSVDTSCDCGIMLSDYTRSLKKIAGELADGLRDCLRLSSLGYQRCEADFQNRISTSDRLLAVAAKIELEVAGVLARYEQEFKG